MNDLAWPLQFEHAQRDIDILIHPDEFEGALPAHAGDGESVATNDRFLGVRIEEHLQAAVVGGVERAQDVVAFVLEPDFPHLDAVGGFLIRRREIERFRNEAARVGGLEEFFAKLRMGDLDQLRNAFANGVTPQGGDAVFRDNVVNIGARDTDAGAGRKIGQDVGDELAVTCRGWSSAGRRSAARRR